MRISLPAATTLHGTFNYYFAKYPHIIRRNRTSVAILQGDETKEELEALADDVMLYFGLGCRNVTKIYVPEGYTFGPMLTAFTKYDLHGGPPQIQEQLRLQPRPVPAEHNSPVPNERQPTAAGERNASSARISVLHYGYLPQPGRTGSGSCGKNEDLQCLVASGRYSIWPGAKSFAQQIMQMAWIPLPSCIRTLTK